MINKTNMVFASQGGDKTPDFKSLVGTKRKNLRINVSEHSLDASTGLIPQYENCQSLTSMLMKININEVEISTSTNTLYDYSNRTPEIEVLMESISKNGQKQPIIVIRKNDKYIVIDGVLRVKAMTRLEINVIDALISDFVPTNEFSLSDLIIHNQIRKEKTETEKLNEIKTILRIGSDDYNSTNDREIRIKLVSKLLGVKGFARNNVYMLEKVLDFENNSDLELKMSERMIAKELSPAKAIQALDIIETGKVVKKNEKENNVLKGFLNGDYEKDEALILLGSYDLKKQEEPTKVPTYPIKTDMYKILQGDVETIELPQDLEIDTIFTSPPYYQIIHYGNDKNELGWEKTPEEYITRLCDIIMKGYERLKDTGSIFINLGDTYQNCQNLAIPERLIMELIRRGLNYVDRIVWDKANSGKPIGNNIHRLMPSYELILHFSKTKKYYFEKIKIQSDKVLKVARGCKEKHTDKVSFHIPNNYNQIRSVIDDNLVESIPGVMSLKNKITLNQNTARTIHVEGKQHPATFSRSLPVIPLLMSCPKNPDTVVFDPFMGSGSCGVTALLMGMKFVGVELYDENIKLAKELLSNIEKQSDEKTLNKVLGNEDVEKKENQLKSRIRILVDTLTKEKTCETKANIENSTRFVNSDNQIDFLNSKVINGDSLHILKSFADNSIDSVVTDPPYGINFLNFKWDYDVPRVELWEEVLRVLKPGGHALVACGTRTQHRMAVNLEDAGFEVRDVIGWVYGTGFPKNRDITLDIDKLEGHPNRDHRIALANSLHPNGTLEPYGEILSKYEPISENAKKWTGWGTALKPSMELWTLVRKPLEEKTVARNVLKYGTGGINIDGCRFGNDIVSTHITPKGTFAGGVINRGSNITSYSELDGRYPTNFIHDGSDSVEELFPETILQSHRSKIKTIGFSKFGNGKLEHLGVGEKDKKGGSASRFFYCAKASKIEKNIGLEDMIKKRIQTGCEKQDKMNVPFKIRPTARQNIHPTVKPIKLMSYLCRLITPPGGTVLDPFNGSGSTGCSAVLEGFKYIGIELNEQYCEISRKRIQYYDNQKNTVQGIEMVENIIQHDFEYPELNVA